MRYLIFLGHPAHFHLFKNIINKLKSNGHQVKVLIRTKDMLEELCIRSGIEYINVLPEQRKKDYLSIAISYLRKYKRISKIIKEFKPNLLMGSEPSLSHLGKFYNIHSFIFSEDDAAIIPQFAKIAYPFVNVIISPESCNAGKWEYKKTGYNGYHKLAYLHPAVFTPDRKIISEIQTEDYFILRFAQLSAYHDKNRTGITKQIALKLIELLKPHGQIFISSERELEPEFEKYRLHLAPDKIHHALYYAKMYIGDSQSMAVESALLGTPGIRFNDFAGEIGVLNELEFKYHITKSFKTNKAEEMYKLVNNYLNDKNLYSNFKKLRSDLIEDKINVFEFFLWFIQNYPESKNIVIKNPDHNLSFK
jgi:predicted glycosyltransferase